MKPTIPLSVLILAASAAPAAEVPLDLLEPPSEGKAVVYFFVPGKTPIIPSISVFDGERQLPILLGAREYFRYECEPGRHAFSVGGSPALVSVQSDTFVRGHLEAGGIYAAIVSNFMADLVLKPLDGRMDDLVNMKTESKTWDAVISLMKAKPPKPPGKERKGKRSPNAYDGQERLFPTSGFARLERLNPPWTARAADAVPLDRLPDPVPGKSLVLFFAPENNPEQSVVVYDGLRRLSPVLDGGAWYRYETSPGTKDLWVSEMRQPYTRYRFLRAELEAGKVYGIYVDESLGYAGARLFGLSGKLDTPLRFELESERWWAIEPLLDAPARPLTLGEQAVSGKDQKEVEKRIKKRSKKRFIAPLALK